jgi:hypothetical protein
MELSHKPHFPHSSPQLSTNEPAQNLRVPTNPRDPRLYLAPSTSSFHNQPTSSTPLDLRSKLRHHSLSSSSENLPATQLDNQNGWQKIKRIKRKRLLNSHPLTQPPQTDRRNRYEMLTEDNFHPEASEKPHPPLSPKPPPIFLHGVINYSEMIKSLTEVAAEEQFLTKSLNNNVVKLACSTPDTYTAIIKHCQEQNIYYHTYQLKEDRAFCLVTKHLHYTTNLEDIITELRTLGHKVRNIINVKHRQTKELLNIFFIDFEPANNKDIYEVTAIQNKIVHIQPPRSTKPHIPLCVRCQQYGHTRKYCNKPFNCVKCYGPHNSST